MKNTLRISFGLLAAIAMIGCQKQAGSLGTTVRGRSAQTITGASATSSGTGSAETNVSVTSSEITAIQNLISTEVSLSSVGQLTNMTIGLHMCQSIPNSLLPSGQTPISVVAGQEIEISVIDSYVAQGALPIVTKLPFITGFLQSMNGATEIAAEFGDATGNIAFTGYIDPSTGSIVQGQLYNDTFSVGAGLQQIGSFNLSGSNWISGCN